MNIRLLKKLDAGIGYMLATALPLPVRKGLPFPIISSILIIRPGGIGDAVLLLPMLNQLSSLYPEAKIEVLAEQRNAEVFSWSSAVSRVWRYDRLFEFLKLFRHRYDLIIDTEQWYYLSAVVARLLNASRLIGFATNERSRLFTDPCAYNLDEYEAGMFLRLLGPLGMSQASALNSSRLMCLPPSEYTLNNPYIVFVPDASVAAKRWPAERFAEVARFCEESGFDVVLLGGKDGRETAEVISGVLTRCLNLSGKTSLTESAVIVKGARLVLSGDTGLIHVAQLLEVPTVALFGPSDPKKWHRNHRLNIMVSAGVTCSPCSRFGTLPMCQYGFRCMQTMSVAMVVEAVSELLQQHVTLPD